MIKAKTIFAAALMGLSLMSTSAIAQDAQKTINLGTQDVEKQHWSFAGPFGTFDRNQLQRGFQVFKEVCSNCHSAHLLAFRNLSEPGGPEFTAAQVKALAASYTVTDPDADGGKRPGLPSDNWPGPDQSQADLKASFGVVPPDMSVLAKARSIEDGFPNWFFNYFTTYAEGGPDYIHAILNGYLDSAPAGITDAQGNAFKLPDGKYYNVYFPGHAIGMPPPLTDGQVKYIPGPDGSTVPLTVDQYSKDVGAYLMWMAEPHLDQNKAAGFRVLAFLLLFAVMMWMVKQRLWRKVH
ncbi:MAG TPA: cytochrome c1 [Devosia sp.]|jgi:ubiquinol-cytochrome c reductase cytochrome c1 subunit|nr:cytochrome c1 [Devosia sp.]